MKINNTIIDKFKKEVRNFFHLIIIIIISISAIKINPTIISKKLISFEKLVDLHLVFLGASISLVTFIYAVTKSIKIKYSDEEDMMMITKEETSKIISSINRNIYRMITSLIVLLSVYFSKEVDYLFIREPKWITKLEFMGAFRFALLVYIILTLIDIVLTTLLMYKHDIDE